jgi:hypothetical protein
MSNIIKLRDLPGVAAIERDLNNTNAWAKEKDDLPARINAVSLSLFGITEADTDFDGFPENEFTDEEWEEAEKRAAEWNLNFDFMDFDYADVEPVWLAAGWDVTDGNGNELISVGKFGCQIIAVLKNLIPHAKLYPGGNGPTHRHLSDTDAATEAEDWGEALARDAQKFQPGRR